MPVLKNTKHEIFAQELAKGKNADEAYVIAGYTKNRFNASRLKTNEHILRRIEEIVGKAAANAGVTVERIISELAKIGFSDIRKSVKWGSSLSLPDESGEFRILNGVSLIDSDQIDDETAGAIAEISQTKDGLKIKLHNKHAALIDLGRHMGLFKEKIEHSGPNGGPIEMVTPARRKAALALLLARQEP